MLHRLFNTRPLAVPQVAKSVPHLFVELTTRDELSEDIDPFVCPWLKNTAPHCLTLTGLVQWLWRLPLPNPRNRLPGRPSNGIVNY